MLRDLVYKSVVVVVSDVHSQAAKGRVKDKIANKIVLDQETYEKILGEVPKYKLITVSVISERLKISGSVAKKALLVLEEKGLITPIVKHSRLSIYTKVEQAK